MTADITHNHSPAIDLGSILRCMASATPKERIDAALRVRHGLGIKSLNALAMRLGIVPAVFHTYLDGRRSQETDFALAMRADIAALLGVAVADIWPEPPTGAAGESICTGPAGSCGANCSCGQSAPAAARQASQSGH